jgi:ATP-binding cassette subfamily C protein LapB
LETNFENEPVEEQDEQAVEASFQFSLAELGSSITSSLGGSIAASEFRALEFVDLDNWEVEDLQEILEPRDILIEQITWPKIERQVYMGQGVDRVYLALKKDYAYFFAYDENLGKLDGFSSSPEFEMPEQGLEPYFKDNGKDWLFVVCYKKSETKLAFIPGIESHWFWSTIWENRSLYLQSGLAALMSNIFALGVALFSMIVYRKIIPANAIDSLVVLASGLVVLVFVDYVTKGIRTHYLSVAGVSSDLTLGDRIFSQVMDLKYKSKKGTVGQTAETLKQFENIREFFASAALTGLIDVPFSLIFIFAVYFIGGWLVVPVLVAIILNVVATLYIQPKMKELSDTAFEEGQNKNSVMVESLTGLETLKMIGAGGFMRRRLRGVLEKQAHISEQTKDTSHFTSNVTASIQQLMQMSVVGLGAILVSTGQAGFGVIIACTILSGKALGPWAQLASILVRLNQISKSYNVLKEFMGQEVEHPKSNFFLPRNNFKGSIEFKNVNFTYPEQTEQVLYDVSFKIEPGEKIAILGHVGSGKTTIGRLISGIYEADSGTILIDGVDIRQIAPSDLREHLGVSAQDVWLMSDTVERNISLGSVKVDPDTVIWAGDITGVSTLTDKHPDGYKMKLSERGESLSGGQRQAVSLARAIVKKPSILVLDEPTSSMDAKSEQRFVAKLKEADFDTTLMVITHRTSLLTLVDKVIIMENGQVAGIGSTDQFMKAQTDHGSAAQIIRNANEAKFPNRAGGQVPPRPSPPASNQPSQGVPAFKIDTKKIMKKK